jgi:hypothetical protein
MMGSAWTSERELLNKNKYLKLDFSGQAYLTSRNMCQGLEGHQVFENQGGERHLQPDRCAVIYGPGKSPKEDFGKLSGKKG